jgi:ABC-type cobalamin/Fe3+-siderophores transport system ATPase subunit
MKRLNLLLALALLGVFALSMLAGWVWIDPLAPVTPGAVLSLRPGEVTAICGPNGAGKSSLMACLAGLVAPDDGGVTLDGLALADMAARARAMLARVLAGQPEWVLADEPLAHLDLRHGVALMAVLP